MYSLNILKRFSQMKILRNIPLIMCVNSNLLCDNAYMIFIISVKINFVLLNVLTASLFWNFVLKLNFLNFYFQANPIECEFCKLLITEVNKFITTNGSADKINETLLNICEQIPAAFQPLVINLISIFYHSLCLCKFIRNHNMAWHYWENFTTQFWIKHDATKLITKTSWKRKQDKHFWSAMSHPLSKELVTLFSDSLLMNFEP